jgi:mannose-6-phosphate isomerase
MAEIWMGAHPRAPSRLAGNDGEIPLGEFIAADPVAALGAEAASRYGGQLPFLFKVLAAAQPLSIQAHPNLEQAKAGFAREEAAGVPRDAPTRNYRDANHKPEVICALTDFWGLRGFRDARDIRADFAGLAAGVSLTLPSGDDELAGFFRGLMALDAEARSLLVESAVSAARERWDEAGRAPAPHDQDARYFWVQRLAEFHPGDIGIVAPLFLHVFALRPGEATYQPAGVLHAYLQGLGVELMANSDNVLRGGLTVKHIDVPELLEVGVFRPEPPAVLTGTPRAGDGGCAEFAYEAPFSEFALSRIQVNGECRLGGARPLIVLCGAGRVELADGALNEALVPGDSVFVPASVARLTVRGSGTLYCATVGG